MARGRWYRGTPVSHIRGDATESAANTFTQTTVDLNVSEMGNEAFILQKIIFEIDAHDYTTASEIIIQVTKKSESAIISYDDSSLLGKIHLRQSGTTEAAAASGILASEIRSMSFSSEVLAQDKIYIGVLGVSQTAALDVKYLILGKRMNVGDYAYKKALKYE